MRCLMLPEGVRLPINLKFTSGEIVLNGKAYVESVCSVLCSPDVRLVIYNAIVSIPEGQVSGSIRQLIIDSSESLEWIKDNNLLDNTRAEFFGRGLCDVYTLVMDSITVTAGNSSLIRVSMEEMMKVLGLKMKSLLVVQQDSVSEFLSAVTGRTQRDCSLEYAQWIILFFFRIYVSCRSLYRQAMSLVPLDTSGKMSLAMGDPITSYSGKGWLGKTDWNLWGYFSWIVDHPSSLVTVIQSILDIHLVNDADRCSPLVYVLNAMAIQRLVDLNRMIKSFEYLIQSNEYLVQNKLSDDGASSSSTSKSLKRWQKRVSSLRKEAADLTKFVMGHLTSLSEKLMSIHKGSDDQPLPLCDSWQFDFSAINDKSLPIAIWWMICQSIDVWCLHAAKRKLKLFLRILIETSLLCDNASFDNFALQGPIKGSHSGKTFASNISLELFRDTVFYEQRFLCRHIASSFCKILEKSVLAVSSDIGKVGLKLSPDWTEFLKSLEKSSENSGNTLRRCTSVEKSISWSSKKQLKKGCNEQKSLSPHDRRFPDCFALFNLLCWMPKGYLSSKSFSLNATCIINIERLVLGSILDCQDSVYCKNFQMLLRLFLSCRRTLKNLILEYCEEKREPSQSSMALIFFRSSSPVLWLLKSISAVDVALQAQSNDSDMKDTVFSLVNHTSNMFLTLSKYQLIHELNASIDSKPPLESSINVEGLNSIVLVAETLKEQMNSILIQSKAQCDDGLLDSLELNKLSAVLSCSQGFWRGFAAALDQIDSETYNIKKVVSKSKHEHVAKLRWCVNELAEFVGYFVRAFFVEDNDCDDHNSGTLRNCSTSSDNKDQTEKKLKKRSLQSQHTDFRNNVFPKCDSFDVSRLKMSLLLGFVRGENLEAAFFLRHLFFAASVLLRLNLQIYSTPLSLSLVPIFVGISQILLVEMGSEADVSSLVSLVWVDGVAKFLEELASQLLQTDPTLSKNVYVKLVELHFIAIGKCIALQGKNVYLASHDTESSTKTLDERIELSESTISCGTYYLDEFKARLRRSFQAFMKKPTELHLQAALETLQRALVGFQVGSTIHYDICIGSSDGGKVSSMVAAGIDCMDLVLKFVTGRKHLTIVKTHIQDLVACLFNIILHLQGPSIFVKNTRSDRCADPDSGSVVLMCVEVLTRVFGKHSIYHLNSLQVGQSLRIPGALFQNMFHFRHSKGVDVPNYRKLMDEDNKTEGTNLCHIDRRFSIELFAACCRLLGTVIKHYKSEAERCVAVLENSVSTLLHCLEMEKTDAIINNQSFAWESEETVKCAAFLRRIYEELRQQKDVFGRHCSLFLSSYIWTYSGFGPLSMGIGREVDKALRPGVYALIDACSADDLQRLHTVFGEGPCRSTLANLQRDYKLNFQYEGKV